MLEQCTRYWKQGSTAGDLLLVGLVGALAIFFGLGDAKLWDRDEPRNARCAKEMMDRGDWIVPTFNGQLRTHKPALTYWLMIASYRTFGVNEFAARFGSASLGLGTLLCTYLMGRRLAGREVGIFAALLLACAVMFQVASRAATPDGPLIFCVTAALTAFLLAATKLSAANEVEYSVPTRLAMAGVYVILGLAVLAKGPVGIVLPGCIMLAYSTFAPWLESESTQASHWRARLFRLPAHVGRSLFSLRPIMGLAIVLVVAAPWYAAVGYATDGEFLRGFFVDHNLRRATETMEGHRGGLWFYPLAILIGFMPGSVFALPTLIEAFSDLRNRSATTLAILFCGLWIAAFVGAFSLAGTKLPSYVTPCYPAVAIAAAITAVRWARGEAGSRVSGWLTGVVLVVVGAVAAVVLTRELTNRLPAKNYLVAALAPLIVGGIVVIVLAARRQNRLALVTIATTGVALAMTTWGWGAGQLNDARDIGSVLLPVAKEKQAATLAIRCLEASHVFYADRTFVEIGPLADEPAVQKQLENLEFDRVLIRAIDLETMPQSFRRDYHEIARAKVFLKDDYLTLFERVDNVAAAPRSDGAR